ncbi:MarR family winged helix-turn-helix transcriptional regulator [Piscinibacter sakaiensis]|uniref:MarR family winged helix-turn-helix transcriptional regulator n=1 Tax=Piscinibacter sakaiensis TaxID=1547922 RepID=UPI003AAB4B18
MPSQSSAARSVEPTPSTDPHGESAARVLRQFRLVFNAIKTHFQQVEKRAGVGGAQVWALSVIRQTPGIGVNELARAMDVRQPTASNLVRTLVEQDLIDVRKDGRDRRAVQLHLRPGGMRVLRRAPQPFSGVLPQALASLDAATLQRLEEDLSQLIGALGADASGAKIPLGKTLDSAGRDASSAYLAE